MIEAKTDAANQLVNYLKNRLEQITICNDSNSIINRQEQPPNLTKLDKLSETIFDKLELPLEFMKQLEHQINSDKKPTDILEQLLKDFSPTHIRIKPETNVTVKNKARICQQISLGLNDAMKFEGIGLNAHAAKINASYQMVNFLKQQLDQSTTCQTLISNLIINKQTVQDQPPN